ncbi:MAG: helix-turn-helix domain-containing protein [Bacteriovoracia bacterium]
MAIRWRLRTYIATKHGIFRATDLQRRIAKKTGVLISLQNLCNYLNDKPKALRLETIEIICSALECELKEFCEIEPTKFKTGETRKLSFKNTPHSKKLKTKTFPDPDDYKA